MEAVVAYVPSGVLHARSVRRSLETPVRSYLQQNNRTGDLSAVVRRGDEVVETPLYLSWLRDAAAVERSSIRVERINRPVLMISGKDDAIWPSFAMAEIARRRLEAHRHPFAFTHLAYDGAGHSIFAAYGPMTRSTSFTHPVDAKRYALGGSPRGNADASADSWPRVLKFLEDARSRR